MWFLHVLASTGSLKHCSRARASSSVSRGEKSQILDNGAEFTSNHFDAWAYLHGIAVDFIRPGKPVENAYIESFNGRLRDECPNSHWFEGLDDARRATQDWRRDYNDVRPHSALGDLAPSAFAVKLLGLGPEASSKESRNLRPRLDQ
jgi:putative transposase